MSGVRVIAALRTPVAPRGGALSRLELHDLAAPVVRRLLDVARIGPDRIDEIIVGNALGAGGNPARMIALASGLPERVGGLSVDRQCCGGLDALVLGAALIDAGQAEVVVAGGAESYSRRPVRMRTDPDGGPPVSYSRPPFTPWPARDPEMDDAADTLGAWLGIDRDMQDAWAVDSHRKALRADHSAEIVPVEGLSRDAFARPMTARLAARAPALSGTITAANAAVAADGAAFCLMVSERVASGLPASGFIYRGGMTLGARPDLPGLAPVEAIRHLLAKTGLAPEALSAAEVMEAYAVQAMACVRESGLPQAIVNPGGGALARGHPIGASGAINAVRLFHELKALGGAGIAAIAAAGGLGTAVMLSVS